MGKLITVWGSSGCGRTTFSAILAKRLVIDEKKVILINGDRKAPAYPILFPHTDIEKKYSLGETLSLYEITSAALAMKIYIPDGYDNLGVMAYAAGDNPLSYKDYTEDECTKFFSTVKQMADAVIMDCSSTITDYLTLCSIASGDIVLNMVQPTFKGLSYFRAAAPLLISDKFKFDNHFKIISMAHSYNAVTQVEHQLGANVLGSLPYRREIDRAGNMGDVFSSIKYCTKDYIDILDKVCDLLES